MPSHYRSTGSNDLVHNLEMKPTEFIEMFTERKRSFHNNTMHEIMTHICALRNSEGGKLTISFTQTCSKSEAKDCGEIIKDTVDKVLSDTRMSDLLELKHPAQSCKIKFQIKGSKELVTMNYNTYLLTDNGKAKRLPSTTHAIKKLRGKIRGKLKKENARQSCRRPSQLSRFRRNFHRSTKSVVIPNAVGVKSKRFQFVKNEQFRGPVALNNLMYRMLEDGDKLSSTENSVAYRIALEQNELLSYVSAFANDRGGRLYYGISSDGIVSGETILENEIDEVRGKIDQEIESMLVVPKYIGGLYEINFLPVYDIADDLKIEDQSGVNPNLYVIKITVHPCQGIVFVKNPESYHVVKSRLERIPSSKWIASFLKYSKAEESNSKTSLELEENRNRFDRRYFPIDCLKSLESLEWVEGYKIVDANEECSERNLEIVCKFDEVPRTADIVKLFGKKNLPLITYKKGSKHKWFETNVLDESFDVKDIVGKLASLEWVEDCKIVDAKEDCNERHLEIVCKLNEVPRTADIVKRFGKRILPFIIYKKGSKGEWFKTNILGQKKYKSKLESLSWVKDFYTGMVNEPEISWQIFITCHQNKIPPMAMVELKKLFGVDIASYVDFVQDDNPNEKSLPSPILLRGPRSGDKLCVEVENNSYAGTIGILGAHDKNHYATTCYHVCFTKELTDEFHETLKKDCANEHSKGCRGASWLYRVTDEERILGQFCEGLYNDDHDIALIELDSSLNCTDAVKFLRVERNETQLADEKQVRDIFEKMAGKVPVEKFGSVTGKTKGQLFALDGGRQFPSTNEAPCYIIKGIDGQTFAKVGDSGSLVYASYNGRRIPFGYVSMGVSDRNIYSCRNLLLSIQKLVTSIQPCLGHH